MAYKMKMKKKTIKTKNFYKMKMVIKIKSLEVILLQDAAKKNKKKHNYDYIWTHS